MTTHGGTIADVLNRWAELGVFAYVLPFLLIFAVVFGILNKSKILGDNRGVQATISLAIALLSLQFDIVPNFFASIFPYTGIGLAILLAALVLGGLIASENSKAANWIFFAVGTIIFLVVLLASLSDSSIYGFGFNSFLQDWPVLFVVILVIAVMVLVMFGPSKPPERRS
jgi:hypothetical protein